MSARNRSRSRRRARASWFGDSSQILVMARSLDDAGQRRVGPDRVGIRDRVRCEVDHAWSAGTGAGDDLEIPDGHTAVDQRKGVRRRLLIERESVRARWTRALEG